MAPEMPEPIPSRLEVSLASRMITQEEYTLLAFDYGEARIGVAVGNTLMKIAHPLTTISATGMYPKIDLLAALITRWQPQRLVVGMPGLPEDYVAAPVSERALQQKLQLINTINNFARRLGRKFNLPVSIINEDFSSAAASSQLNEQGVYGREQSGKLDQLAACAILQSYFSDAVR